MAPPPQLILGAHPVDLNCPECHDDIRTVIIYRPPEPSFCSSISALIICFFCWPCLCIPICCHICLTGIHACPNCNAEIATSRQNRQNPHHRTRSPSIGRSQ